jgi:hypothetical protein
MHRHIVENLAQVGFDYEFDLPPPLPAIAKY